MSTSSATCRAPTCRAGKPPATSSARRRPATRASASCSWRRWPRAAPWCARTSRAIAPWSRPGAMRSCSRPATCPRSRARCRSWSRRRSAAASSPRRAAGARSSSPGRASWTASSRSIARPPAGAPRSRRARPRAKRAPPPDPMPDPDGPARPVVSSPASRPLLLQRDFGALWWGPLISLWGDRLNYLALNRPARPHTGDHHHPGQSSLMLSLHGTVSVLPVLLFAPFAGPWVDRWNLRSVLIVSDLMRALCVLAIPFIYNATHLATPVWTLVFLLFTCNVFFLPAKSAMTPEIVPKEQLLSANTLLAVAGIVGTIAGFAMGGWVVDHWGWPTAILMDAATYGVSVISLACIRYRPRPRAVTDVTVHGYWREILEGVRVVRGSAA